MIHVSGMVRSEEECTTGTVGHRHDEAHFPFRRLLKDDIVRETPGRAETGVELTFHIVPCQRVPAKSGS